MKWWHSQWVEVLMCAGGCFEFVPFYRSDTRVTTENRAKALGWREHGDRWYCPTCLRAVRSQLGPDALVGAVPPAAPYDGTGRRR